MTVRRLDDKKSEIIGNKKKIVLQVDQTKDTVFPNELYKYQIYCKNVSGREIKDVYLQIYNPSEIAIDEDEELQGVNIGDLKSNESHLLYVSARCSKQGKFTVHFICYGEESEISIVQKDIQCSYTSHHQETTHKIHIYNFSPYEDTYELTVRDFSDDVTQLIKRQKLPYEAGNNPFSFVGGGIQSGITPDESQSYIDQKNILYGNNNYTIGDTANPPYATDEHSYQYLGRENFNREAIESFEGENLSKIFNDINKHSKYFRVKKIKTGTNELLRDFKPYNPNGFIYRFGLMSSEIFHNLGVLPEYSHMSDYLFTWAAESYLPATLYPKKLDMNWKSNLWAGSGWLVYMKYTDEYKKQMRKDDKYEELWEFVERFDNLQTAQEFIENEYKFDDSNEYYIHTEDGVERIKKYEYVIKESYYDDGVFFIHIPLSKVPSNFPILNLDQINAIIEKTKPFGMKALIKYFIDVDINIDLGLEIQTMVQPKVSFRIPDMSNIKYKSIPYQYNNIVETICKIENNNKVYEERESTKLIPSGTVYSKEFDLNINPNIETDVQPINHPSIGLNTNIETKGYSCIDDNDLTSLSDIKYLLYQGNFNSMSFKIDYMKSIILNNNDSDISNISPISSVDYQLWTESLSDNSHSKWWNLEEIGNRDYVEIPLDNPQLTQSGIEIGIGFEDIKGKLHGISSEKFDSSLFKIRYTTSYKNNFTVKREGLCNIIGLSYKLIDIDSNTLVVFFLKTKNNNQTEYHYFHSVVTDKVKNVFCFTRNNKKITSIQRWSNLIRFGINDNPKITFNTPQYHEIKTYDPKNILNYNDTSWKNLLRIDKNEYSYAIMENHDIEEKNVDDVNIHFDDIDIPDDAIVQDIKLKTILETNSYKDIYPSIRLQDGYITEESNINTLSVYPDTIECYSLNSRNLAYYQKEYEKAKENEMEETALSLSKKISNNKIFNDELDLSTSYVEEFDDYIAIQKAFWIELSDFSDDDIIFNDVQEIKFCIEGYNTGKEVYLHSQLTDDQGYGEEQKTLIPMGYFKKYIPLKFVNNFSLDAVKVKFRFAKLNNELKIYDTYLDVTLKNKQNLIKEYEYIDDINLHTKKTLEFSLSNYIPGYIVKNGLTVGLGFEYLDPGEYYRIYSVELIVIYQKQNTNFSINNPQHEINNAESMTVINGNINSNVSGMIYNEIIMPETYQSEYTSTSEIQGIELKDALYQSFRATTDNITSVTIFPNGFVGNPDINLKIGLYENKGNTPNKLIKEVRVSGWSKANSQLKNKTVISYDFNVENLIVGNIYWLKFSVDNPSENNYYILRYKDSSFEDFKLLTKENNNYINTFGSLRFYVNTLNSFESFSSLPFSEDNVEYSDPKILINLTKRYGEAKEIKVQKKVL